MSARFAWLWVSVFLVAGCGQQTSEPSSDEQFVSDTAEAHKDDAAVPSPAAEIEPRKPVLGTELAYGEGADHNLVGYLSMPEDAAEPLPGIIVIHEWWGLNDNIRAMTDRLAGEGYIALAVDLYQGKVATDPAGAQELMGSMLADTDAVRDNLNQAYAYLSQHAFSPRVGVIGWCLGGGYSLRAALWLPEDLKAAVMYYGRVSTDEEELAALSTPLLGLFGSEDRAIPVEDVQRFRNILGQMDKTATVHIYSGADHAFANPTGRNYNAEAAQDAWNRTLEFLDRYLGMGAQSSGES